MSNNRLAVLGIGFGLLVLIIGGVFLFQLIGKASKQGQLSKQEKVEETPDISERPYVTLSPRADGRAVVIKIGKIPRGAQIDYEITYITEGVTQGIVGAVAIEPGQDVYEREHAFGTCSRNVCKYDKNVEFGKWTAKIDLADRFYSIGSDWHLQRLTGGKVELKDKFSVNIPSGGFAKASYTMVHENQGLPSVLPQAVKLISGPFHFSAAEKLNKKGTVSVPASDLQGAKIFFWNGSSWQDLGGEVKGGTISASIDSTGTFVVASQAQ